MRESRPLYELQIGDKCKIYQEELSNMAVHIPNNRNIFKVVCAYRTDQTLVIKSLTMPIFDPDHYKSACTYYGIPNDGYHICVYERDIYPVESNYEIRLFERRILSLC